MGDRFLISDRLSVSDPAVPIGLTLWRLSVALVGEDCNKPCQILNLETHRL